MIKNAINSIAFLFCFLCIFLYFCGVYDETTKRMSNIDKFSFLEHLNEQQREAVMANENPELIVAGAGSGKTRVLTYKIAYLLAAGLPAYKILALTFTNKAAREMKNRIEKLVGEDVAKNLWMGTFHSVFARILRQEMRNTNWPYNSDFTIYDSSDSEGLLKQILKEMGLKDNQYYKVSVVQNRISAAKNSLVGPDAYSNISAYLEDDKLAKRPLLNIIYKKYSQRLIDANAMDFDDLLFLMFYLLQNFPEIKTKYQNRFEFVLVDEYQDTNYAQYQIIKLLAPPANNVCVVGDDAQSIYSFRGADIQNILNFRRDFQNAKVYKLERNYRSTKNIVDAAGSLISHNINQIPKHIFSQNESGEKVHLAPQLSDRDEARFIARTIGERKKKDIRESDDFAVLYRTNAQSRVLEDEMRKAGIPYRIYGGLSFYQRKEIKDMLAYLRLAVNHKDEEALVRIINTPARGIGDTTVEKLRRASTERDVAVFEVAKNPMLFGFEGSKGAMQKLTSFATMIEGFTEKAQTSDAYEFAKDVASASGLVASAMLDQTPEGKDRYENLQELLNGLQEFVSERRNAGESVSINEFLQEVSLLTDQDHNQNDSTPRVTLMTIHAAKGLEFPVVFIAGVEENLFPSAFCETPTEVEEERRLMYVAMTRAEQVCYISYCSQRFRFGTTSPASPSRFVKEIDTQFVDELRQVSSPSWSNSFSQQLRNEINSRYFKYQEKPHSQPTDINDFRVNHQQSRPNHSDNKETSNIKSQLSTADTPFSIGSWVMHDRFGKGKVLDAYAENGNDRIVIKFVGESQPKTLLLKFAKLKAINN